MNIKIGIATHLGYGTGVNIDSWHARGWRRFWDDAVSGEVGTVISGDTRWQQAVTAFNAADVDCSVILGGYVWAFGVEGGGPTPDADKLTELGRAVTLSETLNDNIFNIPESRDNITFSGVGGSSDPDMDDFYTEVGLTTPFGHNQGVVSNPYPTAANPQFYTSDVNGVRLVFMTADDSGSISAGALTWLADTALNTDLPVIVFSTDYLSDGSELVGDVITATNNLIQNYAAVNTIFSTAGNVKAVIMGNTGYGSWDGADPSNFTAADRWIVDDVDYIPLNSALMASDAGDNRYYIIEVNTDAVTLTPTRTRANVKVTAFGIATGSKALDQYGIF